MLPVFHTASWNSKLNVPLPVKVYVVSHQLLVMVIASLAPVRVAMTSPLVAVLGEYVIVAVGAVRSSTNLTRRFAVNQLREVKPPATMILLSGWRSIFHILALSPLPALNPLPRLV